MKGIIGMHSTLIRNITGTSLCYNITLPGCVGNARPIMPCRSPVSVDPNMTEVISECQHNWRYP